MYDIINQTWRISLIQFNTNSYVSGIDKQNVTLFAIKQVIRIYIFLLSVYK